MDLDKIDGLLSQLYNQAVALQEVVRLLQSGKVHDVSLTAEQTTQLTQKGSANLGGLKATMAELETEFATV
jgi:hypothetical protein